MFASARFCYPVFKFEAELHKLNSVKFKMATELISQLQSVLLEIEYKNYGEFDFGRCRYFFKDHCWNKEVPLKKTENWFIFVFSAG